MPPQLINLSRRGGAILDWARCYAVDRPPEATIQLWHCRNIGMHACAANPAVRMTKLLKVSGCFCARVGAECLVRFMA